MAKRGHIFWLYGVYFSNWGIYGSYWRTHYRISHTTLEWNRARPYRVGQCWNIECMGLLP